MTVKEFKQDLERETGEKLSMTAAKALYSQYIEQEAEAIAMGKYDVDSEITEAILHAEIMAKPFKVIRETITYHPSTDGRTGSIRKVVASFYTREDAVAAVQVMDQDDDSWLSIEPKEERPLPVPYGPPEEIPF